MDYGEREREKTSTDQPNKILMALLSTARAHHGYGHFKCTNTDSAIE